MAAGELTAERPVADIARLMVIRRMKPLGFTLDQMRDLLDATDRLDAGTDLPAGERAALLERVRGFEDAAQQRVADLRTQLARAEEFADTLRERLTDTPAQQSSSPVRPSDSSPARSG
ncbi:MerR family transcriptional regulator [Streptomyces decoyicus]|uniref:MerR family transcriptional regulator n=1 Tax=Streptomyces decoyicus TaxID=249567 RepID=UPI00399BF5AE